jgi:hypothetical protein
MAESTRKSSPRKAGSGQHRKPASAPAAPIDPEKVAAAKAAKRAEAEAAAERKAAAAARQARKKRQRILTYGAIALVVVVIAGLIGVKVTHKAAPDTASGVQDADPAVVAQITAIPVSVLDKVGDGGFTPDFRLPSGKPPPLVSGGLPRVLYVGGLFCPFCATQRWPLIAALSRFGTFTGLRYARSSATDTPRNINSFTFSGVTYTSTFLAFTPFETSDRNHKPLDTLPPADTTLVNTLDNQPTLPTGATSGTIPFVDIGNRWVLAGASYNATDLEGKTWAQIASAAMSGTGLGQRLDATANWITAALCSLTGNKPATVCSDPVIAGLETRLFVQ